MPTSFRPTSQPNCHYRSLRQSAAPTSAAQKWSAPEDRCAIRMPLPCRQVLTHCRCQPRWNSGKAGGDRTSWQSGRNSTASRETQKEPAMKPLMLSSAGANRHRTFCCNDHEKGHAGRLSLGPNSRSLLVCTPFGQEQVTLRKVAKYCSARRPVAAVR